IWHKLLPSNSHDSDENNDTQDPTALEESRVSGAVKTDFILSAEIMTLALSMIESRSLWIEFVTLCLVRLFIILCKLPLLLQMIFQAMIKMYR
ncbi:DUF808 domain-containing protein, partial [Ochrobactrum sp. MR28]|nr:DUF808 domain-containing protein [Ochrobactrum sp. MR28]MBX8819096.1 DUF808 domain-containing protein [Ochrobactrum sp. MR31]